jgi:hypothetical protein
MSSNSSVHLRKEHTQRKRYSLAPSCTKHNLTFNSAASSSVSKNQKEDSPKDSVALNNPSEQTQQQANSSASYAQTPSAYSQDQNIHLSELPSPHSWPSVNTLPDQEQMDYDLLGLSHEAPSGVQYLEVAPGCPYHESFLESGLEAWQTGRNMSVMERWMLEDGSESGVMFVRGDTGRMITDRGCPCAMVVVWLGNGELGREVAL